jgi:hypothetical protein
VVLPQPSAMLPNCSPYSPQPFIPGLQQEFVPQPRLFMPQGQVVPQGAPQGPQQQQQPGAPVQQGYAPQTQSPLAQAPEMYR